MYLKGNNPNGLGCLEFSYSGDIDDETADSLFGIISVNSIGELTVNGNIMSLVYGDNFKG